METENNSSHMFDNSAYTNPGVLQLRLDTAEIIERVQRFLSGVVLVPSTQADGSTKLVNQKVGQQICNEKGVQHITNMVHSVVNPGVVQGNYNESRYELHVYQFHTTLASTLVANYLEWQMQFEDLELVITFVMNMVCPFLSRLLDNKERESYAQSIRTMESSRVDSRNSWMPFGGKKETA